LHRRLTYAIASSLVKMCNNGMAISVRSSGPYASSASVLIPVKNWPKTNRGPRRSFLTSRAEMPNSLLLDRFVG
jgi:hypothetical protein